MAHITIGDKEYELKLTYKAVRRLNSAFTGGAYEIIGKALQGDLDAFPTIVHAALLHTGENFSQKKVDDAIEELFEKGELTFEDVARVSDEVVTQSFFFAATVEKLMEKNPEMKKALEQIRS